MKPKMFCTEGQIVLLLLLQVMVLKVSAQYPYETNVYVETIAGSGFAGLVDGQGVWTMFNEPRCLAVDGQTNVYVWDSNNRAIRKIAPDLTVTTLSSNLFGAPYDVQQLSIQGSNMLAACEEGIFSISPQGATSIVVQTWGAHGVCVDPAGTIYFSRGWQVFRVTNGIISLFAGSGNSAVVDGRGMFSSFGGPGQLAIDIQSNIYVADSACIRKITPDATVTTPASITQIAIASDSFSVYAIGYGDKILRVFGNKVTSLAGIFLNPGYADGEGINARFNLWYCGSPCGLGFGPDGKLYVADTCNQRIRRIVFNAIPATVLAIDMRPTLAIAGEVTRRYRIESRNSVREPWATVTTLTLTNNPHFWVDTRMGMRQQFYRAVLLP